MKKIIVYTSLLLVTFTNCFSQNIMTIKENSFNIGAKIGFSTSFPVINSLTIENVEAQNISTEYKVGYTGSLFCRINMKRFFIQPEISWIQSMGRINYFLPKEGQKELIENTLNYKTQTAALPVMIGYNVIKKKPYGLSLMIGPKIIYDFKSKYYRYSDPKNTTFSSNSEPFGINIAGGVSITIGRLFLDFIYEFGLNKSETDFKSKSDNEQIVDINLNRRINLLNFSLGFIF